MHVGVAMAAIQAGKHVLVEKPLAPTLLISGEFTGTTREILQWAACKWGIDQNVVFAQAAVESWWQQAQLGDWTANAMRCPPSHGIGADGKPGECPQSYGILQNKYHLEQEAWPGIGVSTAMNASFAACGLSPGGKNPIFTGWPTVRLDCAFTGLDSGLGDSRTQRAHSAPDGSLSPGGRV
jgi:hypothetical protein